MKLLIVMSLLFATIVVCCGAEQNATKPTRKTLRTVKALKKSSPAKRKNTTVEQEKAETYHVPLIVSAPKGVPVSVEVHDDDRHIRAHPDIRPIKPIHLVPLQKPQPRYHQQEESVFTGPVAVPRDYPYGDTNDIDRAIYESDRKRIAPGEYFSPHLHHHHHQEQQQQHEQQEYYGGGDLSAIPGQPGIDYPTLSELPHTGFRCLAHTATPGFYADVETKCQMWHYCQPDGRHDRFLCPNGTIFDQTTRVCNWWFNVHCDSSLNHYDVNFDLYRDPIRHQIIDDVPRLNVGHHQVQDDHPHFKVQEDSSPPYLGTPSVSHPNSFLRHVADFEATRHSHPDYPQGIVEASYPVHSVVPRYPESNLDAEIDNAHRHHIDSKLNSGHPGLENGHHHGPLGDSVHHADATHRHPNDPGHQDIAHHLTDSVHQIAEAHRYPIISKIDSGAYGHRDAHNIQKTDKDYAVPSHQYKRYPSKMAPSPLVRHDSIDYDSSNAHSSLSTPGEKHVWSELKKNEAEDGQQHLKKRKRISRRKLRKHQGKSKTTTERSLTDLPTYREGKVTPPARRYRIVRRRKDGKE